MIILRWWRLAVAVALGAVAAGSLAVTGYLAQLEAGMQQNVEAATALVEVQKSIRDRNTIITEMTAVTDRIAVGLDGVLERSEAIRSGVQVVAEANQSTLALNGAILANNEAATAGLGQVSAALEGMSQTAVAIRTYMADLQQTVAEEYGALRAIGANTARMNAKTPGW